ncbi:MAG: polysaccharide biosynthesis protein [Alphaproteobacteria bacterium]|nr:polysaccharide biosynthesis protein [Alphaproteobacteria bacterium]
MLDNWINKIRESFKAENVSKFTNAATRFLRTKKISQNYRCHATNLSILIGSYLLGSLLIYPKMSFSVFFKELFSIVCIYGALLCWFTEKFSGNNVLRICLAVTTCFAPVIFINNSFSVAVVYLLLVVLIEYVIFSYLQGHRLFSKNVSVYVICEDSSDLDVARRLLNKYKVLELILLSKSKSRDMKISDIHTIELLERQLKKFRYIPFYPQPRKFIYCAQKKNLENLSKLLEVATEYSISIMTVKNGELFSLSLNDLTDDFPIIDRNPLTGLFKNKNIWICYDGRRTVLDLICILSGIASVNLTIICESASLIPEVNHILTQISSFKNYRVKIADLSFLIMNEARPDILFYNMPIKMRFSDEDHLKEALVKNVIDTDRMIKLAQGIKIPLTFVLSSTNSMDANNWTGATQRLGELLCQHADFQCRKTSSRFKVIRIPENVSDQYGFLGEVTESILKSGSVFLNFSESDLMDMYNSKDIIALTLKAIMLSYKTEKTAEVLTVLPQNKADPKDLIAKICNLHGLKLERDIKVHYAKISETMELDNFPNISENLEKTSTLNIFCTKFVTSSVGNYGDLLTVEQISKMNPREIISAVFQSISDKVNPQNR